MEPAAPPPSQAADTRDRAGLFSAPGAGRRSIRGKIVFPYFLLTIIIAALGLYIVTRLIASSLEERFTNQLLEAGRAAGDSLVRIEARQLEVLRPLTQTVGVAAAIQAGDSQRLVTLLEVHAYNNDIDSLIITDAEGAAVMQLSAVRLPGTSLLDSYTQSSGTPYADWPVVANALAGRSDALGDKYAALVETPAGIMLYTSGPVYLPGAAADDPVGVILVGTMLDRVLATLKSESLADIILYSGPDQVVGSTLPGWQQENRAGALMLSPELYEGAANTSTDTPLRTLDDVSLYNRQYTAAYGPLIVRSRPVGVLAVVLPRQFVLQTTLLSRNSLIAVFAVAAGLVVLMGAFVANRIVRPVLALMQAAEAITSGDLSRRAPILTQDELGSLTLTFNQMAARLQDYTRALEEENVRTGAILESIVDGVLVRSTDGEVVLVNNAAQRMLALEEIYRPKLLAPLLENPDRFTRPQRLHINDKVLSVTAAPVYLEDGRQLAEVLVLRDVSQEELATRTKDNFLNQIGHELRTPLTAIQGYADILSSDRSASKEDIRRRSAEGISQQTRTLGQMIDQMLDLTALQSGHSVFKLSPVRLDSLLLAITAYWQSRTPDRRFHLTASEAITIEADSKRLRTAIDAVLQNAVQFSQAGSTVSIRLGQNESIAQISITDEGCGISTGDMPYIFDRFYRGTPLQQDGRLMDVRGMGQGLYIARAIVEGHGGRIEVESRPGEGSRFQVMLPLAQPEQVMPNGSEQH